MDDLFYKPHIGALFGGAAAVRRFPYDRETLREKPVFPYLVLDGGAFFFAREKFGAADSETILRALTAGDFTRHWTRHGVFNWNLGLKAFEKSGLPRRYEWHVWMQRLYVLLPVAQEFLRTHDARWARLWYDIFAAWDAAHPYQDYDAGVDHKKTDLVWRDMQVAWRSLVLFYSAFLLGEGSLTPAQWAHVWDRAALHAAHLYRESLTHLAQGNAHNHVLQIGLALLYAGVLLPECPDAGEYARVGREVVRLNLEKAVFPDGGSCEGSPSYSHFIARLYLEAQLLLSKNGLPPIPGLAESLTKQYEFLWQISTPAGRTLQIGDSYAMDALADIDNAAALFPLPFSRVKRSVLYPLSRFAVLRSGRCDVYADAMDHSQWHQHAGRPQIVVFADGVPVLVDGGCCNYDLLDFHSALRAASAHNTMEVVELRDADPRNMQTKLAVTRAELGGDVQTLEIRRESVCGDVSYTWTRRITLEGGMLRILDRAQAPAPLRFESRLHLAPQPTWLLEEGRLAVLHSGGCEARIWGDTPFALEFRPVMGADNAPAFSPVLTRQYQGTHWETRTEIACEPW